MPRDRAAGPYCLGSWSAGKCHYGDRPPPTVYPPFANEGTKQPKIDTRLDWDIGETSTFSLGAGYAGTELGGKFPRVSAELRPILARHGLVLVSGWYDGRILEREIGAEWEAIQPHLTLLRDLGCRHVVYADTSRRAENDLWGPVSRRPRLAADACPTYGLKLTDLAERMAEFGVVVLGMLIFSERTLFTRSLSKPERARSGRWTGRKDHGRAFRPRPRR